ncbi:MAG: efflux RND transporter periplasmic adaptor subunit [Planctomycetota bacterium]
MKRKFEHPKWIAAIAIIVVLFVVIAVWPKKTQISNDQGSKPVKVMAVTLGTAKLEETIPVTGTFKPLTSIEVVPEIAGQLQRLRLSDNTLLDVGVAVNKGEVIAVIDHDIYLAQLAECEAALEASKVTLTDAEREKNRMLALYQSGSSTEQVKDKAVTAAELAAAQVKQAEAALARIKVTLDKATIEAPVTGVVSRKYVDEHNMVGPSTPLLRIVQIETLKVTGGVSERYLPKLVPGETLVRIKTDAYPEDEFEGTVYTVGVAVDSVTRTGEVEIRVPNTDGKLKPGMFARMTIVASQRENVVVAPDSALIKEGNETYVYVVNGGNAHRRRVKLGLSQGQYYEVLEGLSASDMAITHGQTQLKDGQTVEVVQEAGK